VIPANTGPAQIGIEILIFAWAALADDLLPYIPVSVPAPQPDKTQEPVRLPALLDRLPAIASVLAICIGSVVLVGWSLKIEELKRVVPGFVAMNPMTATLFICSGIALLLSLKPRSSSAARILARALATIVAGVAVIKLLDIGFGFFPNVDEWLFTSKLLDIRDQLPNRMAPNTALNFFFIGASLLVLDVPAKRFSFSQAFAIIAAFGALLPLTGYLYGVQTFRGLASFIPMALHTAATFLVLAAGVFFARPDAPMAQMFAASDPRGVMARRLFPLAVLITLLLGWLCVQGERSEYYESEFGTALLAISLSLILIMLVSWTIGKVNKLEIERAAANARLRNVSRRKDEMIAVVSHDLCSPLTGFRMLIDLLRDGNEKASPELLDIMDYSARRMVSMVRGLLDIAKLESEQPELECEEVLVSDIVRQSMEPLSINANAKHIQLLLEVDPGEPTLYADRLRLSQVFNNLLSNAVKFTSPGGMVTVTVTPVQGNVRIAVKDTGLGISQNDLPHIFDKYYQASNKPTAGEPGTGLGLAIVRELVLLHDGKIDVTSEVNQGTSFIVSLPVKPQVGIAGSRVSHPHTASSDQALELAGQRA
jgi:signal transduction histidine kinase